jgi:branched-subunit amino acid transport protein
MRPHEIAIVAGMTAVTFPVRYVLFALGERADFPPLMRRALRFVPVAVLTAITVPLVLLPDGQYWRLDWRNAYLAGALAAGMISWRWRHLLASIGAGLVTFVLWRSIFPG